MDGMSSDLTGRVRELAEKAAAGYGAEVWSVELVVDGGRRVLRVTLDHPAGVGIDLCEKVSRDLGTFLDVEDVLSFAYVLEVSSPGLTRALKFPEEFARSVGKLAVVILKEPLEGDVRHRGVIDRFDPAGPSIVLKTEAGEVAIPLALVKKAHLDIDF